MSLNRKPIYLSAGELLMIDKAVINIIRHSGFVPESKLNETVSIIAPLPAKSGKLDYFNAVAKKFNEFMAARGWESNISGEFLLSEYLKTMKE